MRWTQCHVLACSPLWICFFEFIGWIDERRRIPRSAAKAARQTSPVRENPDLMEVIDPRCGYFGCGDNSIRSGISQVV